MNIRVVFADCEPGASTGICRALVDFPMITVLDSPPDIAALLRFLERDECDVLVTDHPVPGQDACRESGELLSTLRVKFPALKIVLQTVLDNPAIIGKVIALGISCVVSKRDDQSNAASAIFAAAAGGRYLSPSVLDTMHYVESQSPFWRACHLSRREIEVMRFYMNGLSVSEIARRVDRSIKTISSQKSSAMKKLGIGREIDLYRYARVHSF